MDQRIEAFLADVLALAGETWTRSGRGARVALASCEALFRVREPSNRRALEARAERHRPAGALSCPSAALRLLEIDKGAVHAGLAMATAPIVLV
jgi:hypothetical protein